MEFRLSKEPLSVEAALASVKCPEAGAYNTFIGAIRNHHQGKTVKGLEYSAHPRMAEELGKKWVLACKERYNIYDAMAVHRVGPCEVEDLAIIVVVASAHREEAIKATEWLVNQIKFEVPIWKYETYEDGESWQDQA